MLEEIADYVVLAPLVVCALGALAVATWLSRRRLLGMCAPSRPKRLA